MKPRWVQISGRVLTAQPVKELQRARLHVGLGLNYTILKPEEAWRVDPQPAQAKRGKR